MSRIFCQGGTKAKCLLSSCTSFFFLILAHAFCNGQDIGLGQWETHFSYLSANHLTDTGSKIYCSSYNGLFYIDKATRESKILSKITGLSDSGVTSLAFNQADNELIIAYRSGNMDVISLNEESEPEQIVSWKIFENVTGLPENKTIKQIVLHNHLSYLATNFGIIELDTKLRQVRETFRYIGDNGAEVDVEHLAFSEDSIFALTDQGILASSILQNVNRQDFANWKKIISPGKPVAIASLNGQIYSAFPGTGIYKRINGAWNLTYPKTSQYYSLSNLDNTLLATLDRSVAVLSATNTSTEYKSPLFISPIESLVTATGTFWIADAKNGLLSNENDSFIKLSPAESDTTLLPRTDSSIIDQSGLRWTRLSAALGGGILVKSEQSGKQRTLTTSAGNGSLPSPFVNSLALDNDGYMWFASDKGAGYYLPEGVLENARVDAVLPFFGQQRLLANEKCTSLAVEAGNKKWIGTNNGLYLFNEDGTSLIYHFTSTETPLPANSITVLEYDAKTGNLMIETPNGLVSYRTGSSSAPDNLSDINIFPNPVLPAFSGLVGITGLTLNSRVKITQLSGRLVYETVSEGGTASWNLNDYTGRRAKGGIYMVFVVSGTGDEKLAGKLAIID